jgi:hypothetical protein
MSAIGPKRRILRCNQMSAVGGKADSRGSGVGAFCGQMTANL